MAKYLMSKAFRASASFIPKDTSLTCKSQKLMLYNGLIQPSNPGTFTMMPILMRAMDKLTAIIDFEMASIGGEKCSMPVLGSKTIWDKTNRWEEMGHELFRLQDRNSRHYCLSPTHEEEITSLVASQKNISYKHLPVLLYQMTTKFRDEGNPKYGLLRGREFLMKDLYTFDSDLTTASLTYSTVCDAYFKILSRLEVPFFKVLGATGSIGGNLSHEFHIPASIGEDTLYVCETCNIGCNIETIDLTSGSTNMMCITDGCSKNMLPTKGIEVGHCFLLGDKYSSLLNATYQTESGKSNVLQMGCYGIGVSRLLGAVIEVLSAEEEIRWPRQIAPFKVCLLLQKAGAKDSLPSSSITTLLSALATSPLIGQHEVIIDDRSSLTLGRKLVDINRLGIPWVLVAKQNEVANSFELIDVYKNQSHLMPLDDAIKMINDHFSTIPSSDLQFARALNK